MKLISSFLFLSSLGLRFLFDFNPLSAVIFKFGSYLTAIILSPSIAFMKSEIQNVKLKSMGLIMPRLKNGYDVSFHK